MCGCGEGDGAGGGEVVDVGHQWGGGLEGVAGVAEGGAGDGGFGIDAVVGGEVEVVGAGGLPACEGEAFAEFLPEVGFGVVDVGDELGDGVAVHHVFEGAVDADGVEVGLEVVEGVAGAGGAGGGVAGAEGFAVEAVAEVEDVAVGDGPDGGALAAEVVAFDGVVVDAVVGAGGVVFAAVEEDTDFAVAVAVADAFAVFGGGAVVEDEVGHDAVHADLGEEFPFVSVGGGDGGVGEGVAGAFVDGPFEVAEAADEGVVEFAFERGGGVVFGGVEESFGGLPFVEGGGGVGVVDAEDAVEGVEGGGTADVAVGAGEGEEAVVAGVLFVVLAGAVAEDGAGGGEGGVYGGGVAEVGEVAGAAGDDVDDHEGLVPVVVEGVGDGDDVEVLGGAAEGFAEAELDGGGEGGDDEGVVVEVDGDVEDDGLGVEGAAEGDGDRVFFGCGAEAAPGFVFGRAVFASFMVDVAAFGAEAEEVAAVFGAGDGVAGAVGGGAEVEPADGGVAEEVDAEAGMGGVPAVGDGAGLGVGEDGDDVVLLAAFVAFVADAVVLGGDAGADLAEFDDVDVLAGVAEGGAVAGGAGGGEGGGVALGADFDVSALGADLPAFYVACAGAEFDAVDGDFVAVGVEGVAGGEFSEGVALGAGVGAGVGGEAAFGAAGEGDVDVEGDVVVEEGVVGEEAGAFEAVDPGFGGVVVEGVAGGFEVGAGAVVGASEVAVVGVVGALGFECVEGVLEDGEFGGEVGDVGVPGVAGGGEEVVEGGLVGALVVSFAKGGDGCGGGVVGGVAGGVWGGPVAQVGLGVGGEVGEGGEEGVQVVGGVVGEFVFGEVEPGGAAVVAEEALDGAGPAGGVWGCGGGEVVEEVGQELALEDFLGAEEDGGGLNIAGDDAEGVVEFGEVGAASADVGEEEGVAVGAAGAADALLVAGDAVGEGAEDDGGEVADVDAHFEGGGGNEDVGGGGVAGGADAFEAVFDAGAFCGFEEAGVFAGDDALGVVAAVELLVVVGVDGGGVEGAGASGVGAGCVGEGGEGAAAGGVEGAAGAAFEELGGGGAVTEVGSGAVAVAVTVDAGGVELGGADEDVVGEEAVDAAAGGADGFVEDAGFGEGFEEGAGGVGGVFGGDAEAFAGPGGVPAVGVDGVVEVVVVVGAVAGEVGEGGGLAVAGEGGGAGVAFAATPDGPAVAVFFEVLVEVFVVDAALGADAMEGAVDPGLVVGGLAGAVYWVLAGVEFAGGVVGGVSECCEVGSVGIDGDGGGAGEFEGAAVAGVGAEFEEGVEEEAVLHVCADGG